MCVFEIGMWDASIYLQKEVTEAHHRSTIIDSTNNKTNSK